MQNVINAIAAPVNSVSQAYEARAGKLDTERKTAQQEYDNNMLKVFEFAGDGRVDEAKYLTQAKGLEVPPEIFSNADFAKGLSTAGSLYGDDPAGAQKFAMAWMQTQDTPDYAQRVLKASQLAGAPISAEDRKFKREIELERFKNDLKGQSRRQDLYIDATKASLGSFSPDPNAGTTALQGYDKVFPSVSPGLVGDVPLNVRNNNPGNMRPINASTGFQTFSTPQEGIDAMRKDLTLKVSGQSPAMQQRLGANYNPTLAAVISTWAPPEENDTQSYIDYVSRETGIPAGQTLTPQDIERLIPAMVAMEGGQQASTYFGGQTPTPQVAQSQIPSGLPQGSVMIGTANGRPVYQAPNGERFIDDGNTQNRQQ